MIRNRVTSAVEVDGYASIISLLVLYISRMSPGKVLSLKQSLYSLKVATNLQQRSIAYASMFLHNASTVCNWQGWAQPYIRVLVARHKAKLRSCISVKDDADNALQPPDSHRYTCMLALLLRKAVSPKANVLLCQPCLLIVRVVGGVSVINSGSPAGARFFGMYNGSALVLPGTYSRCRCC